MNMPYLRVNNARYYYEVSGRGQPLLLLHGFTGSLENWRSHVEVFADRYMTVTIDLLGHGRSESLADAGRYQMENCAEDVTQLLQATVSSPANVLGYSMGGRLALYLALTRPAQVARLILESASPGLRSDAERRARIATDEQLANTIERDGLEAFVNRWQQMPFFASQTRLAPESKNRLRQQRLQNQVMGLANSLRGMGTGAQPSLWQRLAELRMPALFLVGELDEKFCQLGKRMAVAVPQARLEVVAESGHTIHLEQPEKFDDIVLRFLRGSLG